MLFTDTKGEFMLQIAICDDDAKDSGNLQCLLEEILRIYSIRYSVQVYDIGEELLDSPVSFDLIFMDIMLNGENGVEIGKKLYRKNRSCKIIFQTYFNRYCGEAVNKSHAFAFLEKPVKKDALEEQIREFLETRKDIQEQWVSFEIMRTMSQSQENNKQMTRLPVRSILYFECQKNERLVKVITEKECFFCKSGFEEMERQMEPFGFAVCNRGIMVNLDKIAGLEKRDITMTNGDKLPLSQRRSNTFREKLYGFFDNPIGRRNG